MVVTNVGRHPMPIHRIACFRSTVFRDCRFLRPRCQSFPATDIASSEIRREDGAAAKRIVVVANRPITASSALRTTFRGSSDARDAMQHSSAVSWRPDATRERDNGVIDSGTWSTALTGNAAGATAHAFATRLHIAWLRWHPIRLSANEANALRADERMRVNPYSMARVMQQ